MFRRDFGAWSSKNVSHEEKLSCVVANSKTEKYQNLRLETLVETRL